MTQPQRRSSVDKNTENTVEAVRRRYFTEDTRLPDILQAELDRATPTLSWLPQYTRSATPRLVEESLPAAPKPTSYLPESHTAAPKMSILSRGICQQMHKGIVNCAAKQHQPLPQTVKGKGPWADISGPLSRAAAKRPRTRGRA